jgi:hypothetical protein
MKRMCRRENTKQCVAKNFALAKPRQIRTRCDEQTSRLIVCVSRVDRISLCAQFPASASGGQTLSKL